MAQVQSKILLPGKKTISPKDPNFKKLVAEACQINDEVRFVAEFTCGECCKRVSNIGTFFGIADTTGLFAAFAAPGEKLRVETFSEGKLVDRQKVQSLAVPFTRFCNDAIMADIC